MLVDDLHAATFLALRLVNTWDPYEAHPPELLTDPQALRAFLRRHRFGATGAVTEDHLGRVRQYRDGLRSVFGAGSAVTKARSLNEVLRVAQTTPRAAPVDGGRWEVVHEIDDGAPLPEKLGAYCALGLAHALRLHGDARLKLCAAEPCAGAFVDESKNLIRRHCSRTCANRLSAAAFRARQRQARGTRPEKA
jgi:predicted RNA-binding Zn ribbon-like protein